MLQSFLLSIFSYTTLLPILFLILLRPLSFSTLTFLPAGPTALIFALLAQYHAAVPYSYRYRVASSSSSTSSTSTSQSSSGESKGFELTSKSLSYLPALQLALSQLPGSLLPAAIGWAVGYAWRLDLLPYPASRWRIPEWLFGGGSSRRMGVRQGAGARTSARSSMEGDRGTGEASGVGQSSAEGRRRGAPAV